MVSRYKIKDTTYYIAVPGSDNYTALSLCCYVDATRCYTRTSKKSINLSDGKILSIPEITLNDLRANGHAFVDLGLKSGNLWATCNIGAESEYKYGQYFAWAETTQRQVSDNDPTTQEYNLGGCGRYWSSSLALDPDNPDNPDNHANAMYLLFPREDAIDGETSESEQIKLQSDCRFYGHTIRAVMSKFTPAQQ